MLLKKSAIDATGLKSMGIHLITVEPGRDSTEHHFHHFEEEAIYVLSGGRQPLECRCQ